tara:strand:+ start:2657 stop:2761 length:105 start_codon:yes stop_codon:yes gene_type:complete
MFGRLDELQAELRAADAIDVYMTQESHVMFHRRG